MNYTKLRKKITKYIKKKHSIKRYNHSIQVAEMSKHISKMIGGDSVKSYIAGLSHDISREFSQKKLFKLIKNENDFSLEFYKCTNLYHGPAGAIFLTKKFNLKDDNILEAVKYHSIGNEGLCEIAKIVFVADYISLDRKHIDDNYRDFILSKKLDEMVLEVVKSTEEHLTSKGKKLLPETKSMYKQIEEYCDKEKRV